MTTALNGTWIFSHEILNNCYQNPDLISSQTTYKVDALSSVIQYLKIEENASYDWNPVESEKLAKIKTVILEALHQKSTTELKPSLLIEYLELNRV